MPLSSISTNLGAMTALQSLQQTSTQLSAASRRISTGQRVTGGADGAAFSIAGGLRSSVAGLAQANRGLEAAKAEVGAGEAAGASVSDTLTKMHTLAVQASGTLSSDQRSILQDQMNSLRQDLDAAAGSSRLTSGADRDMAVTTGDTSITVTSSDLTSQGLGLATPAGTDMTASGAASVLAVQIQTGQQGPAGADPLDLSDADSAARAAKALDQALKTASTASAGLGASTRRIDAQTQFNTAMSDAMASSLGALANADLTEEATGLQALQVRQQIGTQTLSLANQAQKAILSLFG